MNIVILSGYVFKVMCKSRQTVCVDFFFQVRVTDIYYVWTVWSKNIKFVLDRDTFIILCRGLFLPEFLSNRLQTLIR